MPDLPVLAVNAVQAALLTTDGEIQILSHARAASAIHKKPVIVCHTPYTRTRLGADDIFGVDVLELFAFVYPARFSVPTPAGLAQTLGVAMPESFEDYPFTLTEIVAALLGDLQKEVRPSAQNKMQKADPLEIAQVMGLNGKGWPWSPFVCHALGESYDPALPVMAKKSLNIWKHLPEWAERAPEPPPAHDAVSEDEALERLAQMLNVGDRKAEPRPQQQEYVQKVSAAFAPKNENDRPHIVLAEAGTGVGKTLGYLSPASVWAEKNAGTVWISTYTKNLQRQIDGELDRLFPHPDVKNAKVTIRKGRENYLCLLNLEDMINGASLAKHTTQVIAAGLMARWAGATKDGDIHSGDFPGWLTGLLGWQQTQGLSDTRGECIYGACDHYKKCFVERTVRKAEHSQIVVANHALVMIKAAIAGPEEALPQRFVFDEGHHLFEAADSAFAGHLTARETHDMRRWLRGAEGGRSSRARGLKRRVEDLVEKDQSAFSELEAILHEASHLPAYGWSRRLKDNNPQGETEKFVAIVYQQVMARTKGHETPYSVETQTFPLIDGMADQARRLKNSLSALQKPMRALAKTLLKRLDEQAETLDSDTKRRLESVASGLERRAETSLAAWIGMLDTLIQLGTKPESALNKDNDYIDWMQIERIDGRAIDVGMYRHWTDPMVPFAKSIAPFAHGMAITSATLRDRGTSAISDKDPDGWNMAKARTGANYLSPSPVNFSVASPFDYAEKTRIFIINDVNKNNMDQVSAAYRELFKASGGGALGLFTAIQRLRAVQQRIALPLESAGFPLYAQHVEPVDNGTLVDMFRADIHACLLGTDAVRDGVDVPGESLRMLVYDRVPWPRPTILHKARREAFAGRYNLSNAREYDEMLTRLKVQQAYGRLIRSAQDRGVFIMLDNAMPTRLCSAFPQDVEIQRLGLKDTIEHIRNFFLPQTSQSRKSFE